MLNKPADKGVGRLGGNEGHPGFDFSRLYTLCKEVGKERS